VYRGEKGENQALTGSEKGNSQVNMYSVKSREETGEKPALTVSEKETSLVNMCSV
jgi:hypothetical protein